MEDNTDDVGKADYSDDDDEFEPSLEDLEDQLGPVERDPRRETGYGTMDIPPMAAGHPLASPQGAGARSKSPTVSRRQTDESPSPRQLQDQIDALQARLASTVRRKRYEQGTAGDSVRESTFGRHVDAVGYVPDNTREVGVPRWQGRLLHMGGGTYWPVADQPRPQGYGRDPTNTTAV